MTSQILFDWNNEHLEDLNDKLGWCGLYQLASAGGGIGQPLIRGINGSVKDVRGTTVVFRMLFPEFDNIMPHVLHHEAEMTLRFGRHGELHDESIVKVYVDGILWEGVISVSDEARLWGMTWTH